MSYGCANCINARLTIRGRDGDSSRFSQDVSRVPAVAALFFPGSHLGYRQGGHLPRHVLLASNEGVDECRCRRPSRKGDVGRYATLERQTG